MKAPDTETHDYLRLLGSPFRHLKVTTAIAVLFAAGSVAYIVTAPVEYAVEGLVEVAAPNWEPDTITYVDPAAVLTYVNFVYAKNSRDGGIPYLKSYAWARTGSNLLRVQMRAASLDVATAEISKLTEKLNEKFRPAMSVALKAQLDLVAQIEQQRLALAEQEKLLAALEKHPHNETTRVLIRLQTLSLTREAVETMTALRKASRELPSTGTEVARLVETKPVSHGPVAPSRLSALLAAVILTFLFSLLTAAAIEGRSTRPSP